MQKRRGAKSFSAYVLKLIVDDENALILQNSRDLVVAQEWLGRTRADIDGLLRKMERVARSEPQAKEKIEALSSSLMALKQMELHWSDKLNALTGQAERIQAFDTIKVNYSGHAPQSVQSGQAKSKSG